MGPVELRQERKTVVSNLREMLARVPLRQGSLPTPRSKSTVEAFREELASQEPQVRRRAYAALEGWADEPERQALVNLIWEFRNREEAEYPAMARALRQLLDEVDPRLVEVLFQSPKSDRKTQRNMSAVFADWDPPAPLTPEIKRRLRRINAPTETLVGLALKLFQSDQDAHVLKSIVIRGAMTGCTNAWEHIWKVLGSQKEIRKFLSRLVDQFVRRPPKRMPLWYKMLHLCSQSKLNCPHETVRFVITLLPRLWQHAPPSYARALAGSPKATADVVTSLSSQLGPALVSKLIECPAAAERFVYSACQYGIKAIGEEFRPVVAAALKNASPSCRLAAFAQLDEEMLPPLRARIDELRHISREFMRHQERERRVQSAPEKIEQIPSKLPNRFGDETLEQFASLLKAAWHATLDRGGYLYRLDQPAEDRNDDCQRPNPQLLLLTTSDQALRRSGFSLPFVTAAEFHQHYGLLQLVDMAPFDHDHPPDWVLVGTARGQKPPSTLAETLAAVRNGYRSRPFSQPIFILRVPTQALPQLFGLPAPAHPYDLERIAGFLRGPAARLSGLIGGLPGDGTAGGRS